MDGRGILPLPRVQNAGAIDDGLDAADNARPGGRLSHAVEVGGHGLGARKAAHELVWIANRSTNLMAGMQQERRQMAANKTVCAGQKHFHYAGVPLIGA
jgi:hypothetical protein